jgi:hypothetical protein
MAPYVTSNWGISQNVISTLRDRGILLETGMNLRTKRSQAVILDCFILSMWCMYISSTFPLATNSWTASKPQVLDPIDAKDLLSSKKPRKR